MKFIVLAISMLFCIGISAQSTSRKVEANQTLTNIERLNIDFEVKDVQTPDLNLLNAINLSEFENQRKENEDVEIFEEVSGYTIILYSKIKVADRKRNIYNNEPSNSNNHEE